MLVRDEIYSDYVGLLARHGIDSADAPLLTPTAKALRMWRQLRLEIGDTAIYADASGLGDFIGLAASWHGGLPVIRLTSDPAAAVGPLADDVETIGVADAVSAAERLKNVIAGAAGVAAIDLSGNGEVIAMVLEVLPRWGRLMLAGPSPEPFTTAFYTDIHRKGVVVCSAGDPEHVDVRNACRLLADPKRAARLRACVRDRT